MQNATRGKKRATHTLPVRQNKTEVISLQKHKKGDIKNQKQSCAKAVPVSTKVAVVVLVFIQELILPLSCFFMLNMPLLGTFLNNKS